MFESFGQPAMSSLTNRPIRAARRNGAQAGFILLEFLVAFAILTIFLASILAALAVAVRGDRQATFLTRATLLAKSKLAAAGVDYPLRPGTTTADVDNGYEWRAVVRNFSAGAASQDQVIVGLWVEVTVSDPRSNGSRSLTLSSVEIVPRLRP